MNPLKVALTVALVILATAAGAQSSSACGGSATNACECDERYVCDAGGSCACQADADCTGTGTCSSRSHSNKLRDGLLKPEGHGGGAGAAPPQGVTLLLPLPAARLPASAGSFNQQAPQLACISSYATGSPSIGLNNSCAKCMVGKINWRSIGVKGYAVAPYGDVEIPIESDFGDLVGEMPCSALPHPLAQPKPKPSD